MTSYLRWNPVSCLRAATAALFVLLFSSLTVSAQSNARKDFAIEAGDAASTLKQFAQQSGAELLYSADVVEGVKTHAVKGEFTPKDALELMVVDTPLVVSQGRTTGGLAVRRATEAEAKNVNRAIAESSARPARSGRTELDEKGDPVVKLDTFEVFGRKTLNMDIPRSREDTQPYVIFDHEQIEKSGASSPEEFLRGRLTSLTLNSAGNQQLFAGGSNVSSFNLRALGATQTLILVDGHRIASQGLVVGSGLADINGIPLAAIERIEVLPTTASGIFGGSATGGVINVILKRQYSGADTTLSYSDTYDGGGAIRRASISAGWSLNGGKTRLMLAASYSDGTDLKISDRDYVARSRRAMLANNPGGLRTSVPPAGFTTNIATPSSFNFATGQSTPGPNLTLKSTGASIGSNFTFVPVGYGGVSTDTGAALVANAGHFNLGLSSGSEYVGGGNRSLLSTPTVESIMFNVQHDLTSRVQLFADVSQSRNAGTQTGHQLGGTFVLPGSAPANPFNETIYVTVPLIGLDRLNRTASRDQRAVFGTIIQLPGDWRAELDYTWNRTEITTTLPIQSFTAAASTAVANAVTAGGSQFNVFRDVNLYPVDFSQFVIPPRNRSPDKVAFRDVTARIAGPLPWALAAGTPSLSLLAETRKEIYGQNRLFDASSATISPQKSTATDSLYAEIQFPLISPAQGIRGVKSAELQLAGRYDWYRTSEANSYTLATGGTAPTVVYANNRFSSADPTVSTKVQVIDELAFRVSYGTGFMPVPIGRTAPGPTFSGNGVNFGLTDPRRGNQPLGDFTYATGGTPGLRPEKSETWSAGIILTPRLLPGVRLSADWTRIEKHDNLTTFSVRQSDIANELFIPGLIVRGPASGGFDVGPIIAFGGPWFNVARQSVEAIDFALDYQSPETRWGRLDFSLAATHTLAQETQALVTLPVIDNLDVNPRWQANTTLTWNIGRWQMAWTTRYFDSYWLTSNHAVNLNQGAAAVTSQTYHDLGIRYRFPSRSAGRGAFDRILAGMELQVGAKNLLNHAPPLDFSFGTFAYSPLTDPRGGTYFISVKKSW